MSRRIRIGRVHDERYRDVHLARDGHEVAVGALYWQRAP